MFIGFCCKLGCVVSCLFVNCFRTDVLSACWTIWATFPSFCKTDCVTSGACWTEATTVSELFNFLCFKFGLLLSFVVCAVNFFPFLLLGLSATSAVCVTSSFVVCVALFSWLCLGVPCCKAAKSLENKPCGSPSFPPLPFAPI